MKNPKRIQTEFGTAWLDSTNHYYLSVKVNGKWTSKPLQKAVYESHIGPIPSGMHVHHLDGDPANNDPSNLECVTPLEHRRHHAGWVKTDGEWSHKPCCVCGELKTIDQYRRLKKAYGWGYQAECKTCDNRRRVRRAAATRRQQRKAKGDSG